MKNFPQDSALNSVVVVAVVVFLWVNGAAMFVHDVDIYIEPM